MKKSMCITYKVGDSLYVNMTNRCSNRCDFCIRNNGDGAYGSDSLWLTREPTLDEMLESVFSHDLSKYPELVFCGYGEPSYRLPDAVAVARAVKGKYPEIKTRINTNGQSDLIFGRDTSPDYKDAFDTVSISLNSPSPEKYDEICHSIYGERAFGAMLEFAKNVKNYVQNTHFSVVSEFISDEEIEKSKELSRSLGITLRVRDYIPPENK